ncbi:MAG: thioredoxin family protein [Bacilli bacterium]|jgi:hypothetical protein|nr:thioredoxin family protein [Bacilli bacterium]
MTKKKILPLLALLLFPFFASCGNPLNSSQNVNQEKINFHKSASVSSFIALSAEQVKEKVTFSSLSRAYDFPLFVYDLSCSSCASFKEQIAALAKEEHYIFYGITYNSYQTLVKEDSSLYPVVSAFPTLFFFIDGQVKDTFVGTTNYDNFKANMKHLSNDFSFYSLNDILTQNGTDANGKAFPYGTIKYDQTTALTDFIANNANAKVLYSWNACTDCSSLYSDFYLDYMKTNSAKSFYYFEVSYFRLLKYDEKLKDVWTSFASLTGLNQFSDGKVPSLISYTNGAFNKMAIYHNEGEAKENTDGTFSYPSAYSTDVQNIKSSSAASLTKEAEEQEIKEIKELLES